MTSPPTSLTESLLTASETRISAYDLTKASPIPDSRIHEIVQHAIKHTPSSFNVQSARAVILLKDEHDKLWSLADQTAKSIHPEAHTKMLSGMIKGFSGAYGTILWFEDSESLAG